MMDHLYPPTAMAGFDALFQLTRTTCERVLKQYPGFQGRNLAFEPRSSVALVFRDTHGAPLLPSANSPHEALRKLLRDSGRHHRPLERFHNPLPLSGDPSQGQREYFFVGYRLHLESPTLDLEPGTPGRGRLSWRVRLLEQWRETDESFELRKAKEPKKSGPSLEEMGFDKNVLINLYGLDPLALVEDDMFEDGPDYQSTHVAQAKGMVEGDMVVDFKQDGYDARGWLDFDLTTVSVVDKDETFVALGEFGVDQAIQDEIEKVVGDRVPVTPQLSVGGKLRAHEKNPGHLAGIGDARVRVLHSSKPKGPVLALALTRTGGGGGQVGWLYPINGSRNFAYGISEAWIAEVAQVRWKRPETVRQYIDAVPTEVTLNGKPSPATARVSFRLDQLDEVLLEAGEQDTRDAVDASFSMTVQLLEVVDPFGDELPVDDDWKTPESLPFLLRTRATGQPFTYESWESITFHRSITSTLLEPMVRPFRDGTVLFEAEMLVSSPVGAVFLNAGLQLEVDQ